MRIYARLWFVATLLLCAAGVLLAIITVPVSGLVTLAIGGGIGAAVVIHVERQAGRGMHSRVHLLDGVLVGAGLALGAGGWADGIGIFGMLLVAILLAASPPVIVRCIAWSNAPEQASAATPAVDGPAEPTTAWSTDDDEAVGSSIGSRPDDELVMLWRTSYVWLAQCHSASELHRLVATRRSCLDELERRYPDGFRQWIPAARAAGDPTSWMNATPQVRPDTG